MKRTSSILLIVSLATVVRGGLTTDTLGVKGPVVDQGIITDTLGFDGGDGPDYITPIGPGPSDFLVGSDVADSFDGGDGPDYLQPIRLGKGSALVGSDAADSLVGSDAADSFDGGDGPDYLVGSDAADSFDGGDGPDYVYEMIEMALSSAGGLPVTLQDLFALPGVFDALHAKGPAGDELRGYVDWLMMTGILLGGPGSDSPHDGFLEEGPAPTGEVGFLEEGPAPSGEFQFAEEGPAPSGEIHGWKIEEGTVVNGYTAVEWTYLTDKPQEPSSSGLWVEEGTR